jgi:hypothetical protein
LKGKPVKYTPEELDDAAIADQLYDAKHAEEQAITGPFYPERGITAERLLAFAARCRQWVEAHKAGGAHKAVLKGEGLEPYEPCNF